MDIKLNDACKKQHEAVLKKGFEPQPVAINLMLIVSELGEACEADRKNRHADYDAFRKALPYTVNGYNLCCFAQDGTPIPNEIAQEAYKYEFEKRIKDSFEDEIADAFLRLMDLCGAMNIDIESAIKAKAAYNELRPHKHGKAY
jgi:NTP pyrophosphatase (non-canonical NTP hydrolase)